MDGDRSRARRLRSFAIGGLVGAAGAIATARRASGRSRRPRDAPGGLAAFEDAPCFLELVGEEAQRYREGGDDRRRHVEPDVAVGHEVRRRGHVRDASGARRRSVTRNQAGIRRSRNVIVFGRDQVRVRRLLPVGLR